MGGIVSQEVLKSTTAQYIPLDNLFVFDGIHSKVKNSKSKIEKKKGQVVPSSPPPSKFLICVYVMYIPVIIN